MNQQSDDLKRLAEARGDGMNKLAVMSPKGLHKGQVNLYNLIVERLDSNQPLTIQDAEHIWKTKVCRNLIDGVPHRSQWVQVSGGWKPRYIPMTEDEIKFTAANWLMKNIGSLVVRGYLRIIPMVKLEDQS